MNKAFLEMAPMDLAHCLWQRYRVPQDVCEAIKWRLNCVGLHEMTIANLEHTVAALRAKLPPEEIEERQPTSYKSEWE